MRVIWLASWYPNKLMPFNGDFVKRHAEATSLYADIHVIHVVRDADGSITNNVLKEEFTNGRLKETIIYYYQPSHRLSIIEKFLSVKKYNRLLRDALKTIVGKDGKPDIFHVYIGMKAGIIGRRAARQYGVPYIVSEQWTGLLRESTDNFSNIPGYLQHEWRKLFSQAACVMAVSEYLAKELRERFQVRDCVVIPNVVDTTIFYPDLNITPGHLQFIHISTMDSFKNPEMILEAFAGFAASNPSATLTIFAPREKQMKEKCSELKIEDRVFFHHEVPQRELVAAVRRSDALILYSSYETFGCVVIEANACGVPVIASNIPVMNELIKDGINGVLAKPKSPRGLTQSMLRFEQERGLFKRSEIAEKTVARFNYKIVGNMIIDLYQRICKQNQKS